MSNMVITRLAQLAHPWREAGGAKPVGPEPQAVNRRVKFFSKAGKAALAAAIALSLPACVESEKPLLTDVQALAGPEIEVHFYENFVDRKASDFHISVYRWEKDKYVRETRSAQGVPSFAAKAISANDFIIEGSGQNTTLFHYWIGRKLFDGVYLIFPVIEADVDEATRNAICAKKQAEGICRIGSYDELVTLARATAAQPVRDPALGVLVAR